MTCSCFILSVQISLNVVTGAAVRAVAGAVAGGGGDADVPHAAGGEGQHGHQEGVPRARLARLPHGHHQRPAPHHARRWIRTRCYYIN